jgi:hypothetical protein
MATTIGICEGYCSCHPANMRKKYTYVLNISTNNKFIILNLESFKLTEFKNEVECEFNIDRKSFNKIEDIMENILRFGCEIQKMDSTGIIVEMVTLNKIDRIDSVFNNEATKISLKSKDFVIL